MSEIVSKWAYTKGLHDLGNGSYAYLQPDGSWGWSNAGLISDSGESLLVDTLFDLPLTQEMLDTMRRAQPAAATNRHRGQHPFQRRSHLRQPVGGRSGNYRFARVRRGDESRSGRPAPAG